MSYQDFEKAMELAKQCEYYEVGDGQTDLGILRAELMLGIRFSKQCREFYKKYNYLSFFGYEMYGVYPDKKDVLVGNSVGSALAARKEEKLPRKWVPLCFLEDGYYAYMDYSHLNKEGEPRIIEAVYEEDEDEACCHEITDVLGEDLGAYLLETIQCELEDNGMGDLPLGESVGDKASNDSFEEGLKSIDEKMAELDRLLDELERRNSKGE